MAFLTKTLLVCLSLICVSQAIPHYYPGMMGTGMMHPSMMGAGMMRPGMMGPGMMGPGMMGPGMMGPGMMGMPYGMYKEGEDGSVVPAQQEGVPEDVEEAYMPEGAEVHDPQMPRRSDPEEMLMADEEGPSEPEH